MIRSPVADAVQFGRYRPPHRKQRKGAAGEEHAVGVHKAVTVHIRARRHLRAVQSVQIATAAAKCRADPPGNSPVACCVTRICFSPWNPASLRRSSFSDWMSRAMISTRQGPCRCVARRCSVVDRPNCTGHRTQVGGVHTSGALASLDVERARCL
jgi:hypothetical protein